MHSFFWWGVNVNNFLFYGYDIVSILTLLATCFGLLALGILMEYLGLVQAKIRHGELMERQQHLQRMCPSESDSLLTNNPDGNVAAQESLPTSGLKKRVVCFFKDLCLWLSQQCIGYLLMLAVMAYNVYLIIAIVVGYALGYFLFGQTAIKIKLKNCQVKRDTFCMSDCNEPDKTALIRPGTSRGTGRPEDLPDCHNVPTTISDGVEQS